MKIGIIGYGIEGTAAATYFKSGNEITICDQDPDIIVPPEFASQLGHNYLADISRFDLLVRSPNVHPDKLVAAGGPEIVSKVTSNTNEFFRACPTKNIIGVTGTKGKGTTATIITELLREAGYTAHLGGNIGLAALDLLSKRITPADYVILELSSFQLIDLKYSPHTAICLMIAPEHLDWHPDTDEYFNAKSQLFRHQTTDDVAIYKANDPFSTRIASTGKGWKIPYGVEPGAVVKQDTDREVISIGGQDIIQTDQVRILGRHNFENICAGLTAVWQVSQDVMAFKKVLTSFRGLEHRLELVGQHNGVNYYDDSFGTNPETAIVALQAIAAPKVLILGGSDKASDYTELAKHITAANIRRVLLIGNEANRIQAALDAEGFQAYIPGGEDMGAIVQTAAAVAEPGDAVLLSPACASYDMFLNYKDRGNQFKANVQALAQVAL